MVGRGEAHHAEDEVEEDQDLEHIEDRARVLREALAPSGITARQDHVGGSRWRGVTRMMAMIPVKT
jgi:hypothetical protein